MESLFNRVSADMSRLAFEDARRVIKSHHLEACLKEGLMLLSFAEEAFYDTRIISKRTSSFDLFAAYSKALVNLTDSAAVSQDVVLENGLKTWIHARLESIALLRSLDLYPEHRSLAPIREKVISRLQSTVLESIAVNLQFELSLFSMLLRLQHDIQHMSIKDCAVGLHRASSMLSKAPSSIASSRWVHWFSVFFDILRTRCAFYFNQISRIRSSQERQCVGLCEWLLREGKAEFVAIVYDNRHLQDRPSGYTCPLQAVSVPKPKSNRADYMEDDHFGAEAQSGAEDASSEDDTEELASPNSNRQKQKNTLLQKFPCIAVYPEGSEKYVQHWPSFVSLIIDLESSSTNSDVLCVPDRRKETVYMCASLEPRFYAVSMVPIAQAKKKMGGVVQNFTESLAAILRCRRALELLSDVG